MPNAKRCGMVSSGIMAWVCSDAPSLLPASNGSNLRWHSISLTTTSSRAEAAIHGAAPELACLRSTAAMPPFGRTPELSAMLEAAQLTDQLDALLPLDAGGAAAPPDSPAARQRALRAMLKASDTLHCGRQH